MKSLILFFLIKLKRSSNVYEFFLKFFKKVGLIDISYLANICANLVDKETAHKIYEIIYYDFERSEAALMEIILSSRHNCLSKRAVYCFFDTKEFSRIRAFLMLKFCNQDIRKIIEEKIETSIGIYDFYKDLKMEVSLKNTFQEAV